MSHFLICILVVSLECCEHPQHYNKSTAAAAAAQTANTSAIPVSPHKRLCSLVILLRLCDADRYPIGLINLATQAKFEPHFA